MKALYIMLISLGLLTGCATDAVVYKGSSNYYYSHGYYPGYYSSYSDYYPYYYSGYNYAPFFDYSFGAPFSYGFYGYGTHGYGQNYYYHNSYHYHHH